WQPIAFYAGWLALLIALISPIDTLGGILFSAHMAQHEILMIVAAPLLVLGHPLVTILWALPAGWRVSVGRFANSLVAGPMVATVLHAIALWIWHLPSWYQATLRSDFIHALQHMSFLLTAMLFWWALIHGRFGRMGYGVAVVYVFVTAAHSGALGALIAFSPQLIYPIYQHTTAQWGLDAIEDQQLEGLIMWIAAGVVVTVRGVALLEVDTRKVKRRSAVRDDE